MAVAEAVADAVERHPVCARIGGAVPVFYDSQMQDAVAARMGKTKSQHGRDAGSDMLLLWWPQWLEVVGSDWKWDGEKSGR